MKQKTGGMQQAMDVAAQAAGVDDDEVMIAADDAGVSAVTQKMGKVLQEEETPDPEKAGSPAAATAFERRSLLRDAASTETGQELVRQAEENARLTHEQIGSASDDSDQGS